VGDNAAFSLCLMVFAMDIVIYLQGLVMVTF
jgi:hypothetical protein